MGRCSLPGLYFGTTTCLLTSPTLSSIRTTMGKSCSKICHFHHRSTSSTTFVVQPVTEQCTGKRLAVVPEIALVTTNVTEENQEDAVVIEMQESERRRDDVYSALHSAIKSCDFSSFQSLFEKADTVLSPEDAFSLLISACASNQTDISRLTLTRVRDVNVYTYPYENPLLLAIKHKNIETVLSLIEAGATLNPAFRNKEDEVVFSPVLAAVRAGDPDVLKLVVESGGDLAAALVRNRQGPTGTTVLDVVNPRHEDVKEYLAGAYPLARFQVRVTQKTFLTLTPEQVDEELTQLSLPGDFKLNCHGLTPWLIVCAFGVAPAFRRYLQATPGLVNSCDTVPLT